MPIEFHCPGCEKKLKTGDDKAGKSAKCPQCGTTITVPAAAGSDDEFGEGFGEGFPAFDELGTPTPTTRPFQARSEEIACPMCGAMNAAMADRCYACGESLLAVRPGGPSKNLPRHFSAVWQQAWDVWSANLGINVAAALIGGVIFVAVYAVFIGVMILGFAGLEGAGNDAGGVVVMLLMMVVGYLMFFLAYGYLNMGFTNFALHQLKGRQISLGELFQPLRRLPAALFATFVVGLVMFCLMIPGYVAMLGGQMMLMGNDEAAGLLLMLGGYALIFVAWGVGWTLFWPIQFAIVDRPAGVIAPITGGVKIGLANFKLSILLALTHTALVFVGAMMCYIGLLFAVPLSYLLFAVAYERCKWTLGPSKLDT